ncbi:MAG: AI-2E family transporter [Verrucomicrobiae bacterium]|nr:AI-2E family transporter [Verrucomicrobiae bacterium]
MNSPNPQQQKLWYYALSGLSIAVLGLLIYGLGYLFVKTALFLKSILLPLAIAAVVAYLMEPVVCQMGKWKIKRPWAVLILFGVVILVLVGLGLWVVPLIINEINSLIENFDTYWDKLVETVTGWGQQIGAQFQMHPQWADQIKKWGSTYGVQSVSTMGKWLLKGAQQISTVVAMSIGLTMVPLFVFYFLQERPKIEANWKRYVPLRRTWFKEEVTHVLEKINEYLIVFFRGQVVVAACIGLLNSVGLVLIGLDFGLLIGIVSGVLSIIPYLGIILSITPALTIAYLQSQGFLLPGLVVVVFVVTQMIEGFFITPKIMGDRVGLHPLTVIIAILFWSQVLGGILGALLAIPLTATVRVLFVRYILNPDRVEVKA